MKYYVETESSLIEIEKGTIIDLAMDTSVVEEIVLEELNECEPLRIGSLEYLQGDTLKAVDPVAFRCAVADFESFMREDLEDEVNSLADGDTLVVREYVFKALDN